MPYSNWVFITMNWIKFMGQEMKRRFWRIRFLEPHLLNQSSFYSRVHCPLLFSPKFSNQEILSVVLTVTSTWMFSNITYNGSWDICNLKLSRFRSQLLMAPLQLQWQLRSFRFLLAIVLRGVIKKRGVASKARRCGYIQQEREFEMLNHKLYHYIILCD